MSIARRCSLAALIISLAAGQAEATIVAQQHRPIDPARTRPAPGALTTLGGPKTSSPAGGPRFPLVPAGALAAHPATAAVHRPAASQAPHTVLVSHGPVFHPLASGRASGAVGVHPPVVRPLAPGGSGAPAQPPAAEHPAAPEAAPPPAAAAPAPAPHND
jgi:hypothetical protein